MTDATERALMALDELLCEWIGPEPIKGLFDTNADEVRNAIRAITAKRSGMRCFPNATTLTLIWVTRWRW
jgi:hypothetical protein